MDHAGKHANRYTPNFSPSMSDVELSVLREWSAVDIEADVIFGDLNPVLAVGRSDVRADVENVVRVENPDGDETAREEAVSVSEVLE